MCFFKKKEKIEKKVEKLIKDTYNSFDLFIFNIKQKYPDVLKSSLYDDIKLQRYIFAQSEPRIHLDLIYSDKKEVLKEVQQDHDSIENYLLAKFNELDNINNNIQENKMVWFKPGDKLPFFFVNKYTVCPEFEGDLMYSPNLTLNNDGTITGVVYTTSQSFSKKMVFNVENNIIVQMNKNQFDKYLRDRLAVMHFITEKESDEYITYLTNKFNTLTYHV